MSQTTARGAAPSAPGRAAPSARLKVALSLLAVAATAAIATHGTSASFTASASRGHMITTGTPSLVLGATNAPTNRLGIDVSGLAPGDAVYRSFDLTNVGTHAFTTFDLTSVATVHSLLDTDAAHGLQITLQRCPVAWTESGTSPNFTYTCAGSPATLVSGPIIQNHTPLIGMVATAASGTDHLLLTETLPGTADNTFTGLTSAVTFTFNAS